MEHGSILAIISLTSLITVIILFKLVYRHNPNCNERYGAEIILFHSDERYKKRVWRFNLIEELRIQKSKGKINENLTLKLVVGEFSENTQEIVKHAANHGFTSITVIAGPNVFCEDRTEIYTILDKYPIVNYFILSERPTKHFMIFNNTHLYVEKPHRHTETRGSVGIKKCNKELLKTYLKAFEKILTLAKPLTKKEVLNQQCYKD
ncbi:hypothetical protein [Methanobacterium ferruginis]|uniref:hypothetical protein n=1 Tax=Methanobacterium ferruginis TaxID=710191 RepID=UPI002573CC8E|nr:hypothetical protein [Methanobacterium ferruginis]BDZ68698.1 hypothetical protein GCM10025860_21460 [Methanobacterium ferruginis]